MKEKYISMELLHEAQAARAAATRAVAVYEKTKAASSIVRAARRDAPVKSAAMDLEFNEAFEAEVKAEFQAVKYALRADAAEMAWWDEA